MKKRNLFAGVLSLALALLMVFAFAACGDPAATPPGPDGGDGTQKAVSSIEITEEPKTEYYVGDVFSLAGGKITVTYEDGTTEVLDMTADGVTSTWADGMVLTDDNHGSNKNIVITYGGKTDRFRVNVAYATYTVTFELGGGAEPMTAQVTRGDEAERPESDPSRTGYTFYDWYADEALTVLYDFSAPLSGDTTIYASWRQNGAAAGEYLDHVVTYDLNYYGVAPQVYPQIVADGEKVRPVAIDTDRAKFTFGGWYTDEALTQAFDEDAAITADLTVRAKWTRTDAGSDTYVFEAENVDLSGMSGPGFSGSATEGTMIVTNTDKNASGNKYVSYLYRNNLALKFVIASDKATTATLSLSLAAELTGVTLNKGNYKLIVNDVEVDYGTIALQNGAAFSDSAPITIQLKEGQNTIILRTANSEKPAEGGTYEAIAPMVDCIKLTTDAVLIWDANAGLPMAW